MKRILSIAVAAAALNAVATVAPSVESFESQGVGKILTVEGNVSPMEWYYQDTSGEKVDLAQETAVAAYGSGETPSAKVAGDPFFSNPEPGSRYLSVDCVKPLLRNLKERGGASTIDDGAYISMLAKFTPYDSLPDVAPGDKLHVWMASDATGARQLVVTAGKIVDGSVVVTHYAVGIENDGNEVEWDEKDWHSILLKTYSAVGGGRGSSYPAIVVFVDSKPATIKGVLSYDENNKISINTTDLSVGDAAFEALVTDVALASKLAEKKLFPSLVTETENGTADYSFDEVTHVAFLGTGGIDSIAVNNVDPCPESLDTATVTVSASAGVTYSPASVSGIAPGGTATFTITPPAGGTITKIMLGPTDVTSLYQGGEITVSLPDPLDAPGYVLTVTAGGIVATVNGVAYDNLKDALDASAASAGAGDYPAVLGKDLEWENDGETAVQFEAGKVATLDLNGHTIEVTVGEDYDEYTAFITCAGSLTVIDGSVAQTGKMVAPVGKDVGMYVLASENSGVITVLGGTFEGGFDLDMGGTYSLAGGKYLNTFFGASEFDLEASLADGFAATLEGGYWIVAADSPGDEYPSYIDTTNPAIVGRYNMWKDQYGADTMGTHETAFLLNIAPDAVDQTLEPAEIIVVGGKVVIKANQTLTGINGRVYIKTAVTPGGLTSAEWSAADLEEGNVQVTPGAGEKAGFYKIKVDF